MTTDAATNGEFASEVVALGLPPDARLTLDPLQGARSSRKYWEPFQNRADSWSLGIVNEIQLADHRSRQETWPAGFVRRVPSKSTVVQEHEEPFSRGVDSVPWWLVSALSDLQRLQALPENWDSYQSPRIDRVCIAIAGAVLQFIGDLDVPAPSIVPVAGGGVQIEWQHRGRELELEISPGLDVIGYLKVHSDGTMEEEVYSFSSMKRTCTLVRWLLFG